MNADTTSTRFELTKDEEAQCIDLEKNGQGLSRQRASALLHINSGNTYPAAAVESGLSIGQVRYLVTSFKNKRMALFSSAAKAASAQKKITKPAKVKTDTASQKQNNEKPDKPLSEDEQKAPAESHKHKKTEKKNKDKEKNKKKKQSGKKNSDKKDKKSKKNKKKK